MKTTIAIAVSLFAVGCATAGTDEGNTNDPPALRHDDTSAPAPPSAPRTADDRGDLSRDLGAGAKEITFNHPNPHELTIPTRDFRKGMGGVYEMTAGGGGHGELHTHTVTLTDDEVGEILDGAELTFESSVGGVNPHTHSVTIAKR